MPDVSTPLRKDVARFGFNFFSKVRRRPVCNHLDLVEFVARTDPLIFLFVSRKHFAIARGAAIQLHNMLLPKIDILLSIAAIPHRFFKQLTKCLPKLRQIDPVLWPLGTGNAWLHFRQIQIDIDAVIDFAFPRHAKYFLFPKIIFECKALHVAASGSRSEERRVGKEWRSGSWMEVY